MTSCRLPVMEHAVYIDAHYIPLSEHSSSTRSMEWSALRLLRLSDPPYVGVHQGTLAMNTTSMLPRLLAERNLQTSLFKNQDQQDSKKRQRVPLAPARYCSRKGPGPLPCPIQLDPTFLHQYAQKKRPLEFSNACEVVEERPRKRVKFVVVVAVAVVESVVDEEDESSFCFSLVSDSDDEDSPCSSLYFTDSQLDPPARRRRCISSNRWN
jgi:hypothetical protein